MGLETFNFPFIMDFVQRYVSSLNELLVTFITNSVENVLSIFIGINAQFPILELVNIILIPLKNLIMGTGIGQLTVLEFTLGFGFSIYMVLTFFRWVWNTFPVV